MTSAPLRVLVADDELMARKRLERLLGAIEGCEVAGSVASAQEVIERAADVDVVLLDVDMPGLSGLDALDLMGAAAPAVVYVTAHAEHAVRAFDQGAVDYVLKPVAAERLARALDRARERLDTSAPQGPAAPVRLPVETRKGVVLLAPEAVSHAVLVGELVELHTDEGVLSTTLRLSDLEARLPASTFLRVHRRGLLNLARVRRLEPLDTGGYLAHMDGGGAVTVSRAAARRLRRMLAL